MQDAILLTTLSLSALLIGAMLFFPTVVAPTVFKTLDEAQAGRFLRRLFPGYYLFLIVGSATAAVLAAVTAPGAALLLAAVALSTLWVRQVLTPRINAFRDAEIAGDAAAGQKFKSAHRLSVIINMVQLAGLIALVVVLAMRL